MRRFLPSLLAPSASAVVGVAYDGGEAFLGLRYARSPRRFAAAELTELQADAEATRQGPRCWSLGAEKKAVPSLLFFCGGGSLKLFGIYFVEFEAFWDFFVFSGVSSLAYFLSLLRGLVVVSSLVGVFACVFFCFVAVFASLVSWFGWSRRSPQMFGA